MRRLRYTPAALRDLTDIAAFIARGSGSHVVAERFTDGLRQQCRALAELPGFLGRAGPELLPGIRSYPDGG